jgi:hypothetical protein
MKLELSIKAKIKLMRIKVILKLKHLLDKGRTKKDILALNSSKMRIYKIHKHSIK